MERRNSAEWKVRSALREATEAVHERLHQAPPFAAIANRQLDVRGYGDLLGRIAAFHFTVGPDLDLDDTRRGLLTQDLETLGSPAPAPLAWSSPDTDARRLGWAYVVEGSTLGGKVIYRHLDYLFGDSPAGRRFFRGTSADATRWQALCRRLEAKGRTRRDMDEMIGGAAGAFALFEQMVAPAHADG